MILLRLLIHHVWRYHRRHLVLGGLNILGVALGVAVFTAIQVVNHSALQSFRASLDVVAGKANFVVQGEGFRLPEELFLKARQAPGVIAATPILEEVCLLNDFPGEYLQVIGLDLFTNRPFSTFVLLDQELNLASATDFLTRPDHLAISEKLAAKLGLKIGDSLTVLARGRDLTLTIHSLIRFSEDTPGADEHIAIMDIASVQETFQALGQLDRIDLILDAPPAGLAQAVNTAKSWLAPHLPGHAFAGTPERRSNQVETMLGAFQLNLTALSLISLMVGTFLIYNTVAASVIKRRGEIGLLRTLGLERWQIQTLFIIEASALGLVGALLGLVGGSFLASLLVQAVSTTITSLYILLNIQELFLSPWSIGLALAFGLGSVIVGAWWPAREASRISVVEALSPGSLIAQSRKNTGRWTLLAIALLMGAIATGWMARSVGPPFLGFVSAFFALISFAFWVPLVSQIITARPPIHPIWLRLAFQQFGRSLHRNSITIAALVAAMAMLLGVSIMIHSFRATVNDWLNRTLAADFFIAPASTLSLGPREKVPLEVAQALEGWNLAARVGHYRESTVVIDGYPAKISATQVANAVDFDVLSLEGKTPGTAIKEMAGKKQVLVSEPFRNRTGYGRGQTLTIGTPTGPHEFEILDVFKDYTTERGVVLVDLTTYRELWQDESITSAAVFLVPGTDREQAYAELREILAPLGTFLTLSRGQLREEAIRVFDQTFSVTYLLRLIAFGVAGLGIFLTLTILISERTRLIAVLRANGASRPQIIGMVLAEALLIGAVGWILGVIAGFALAAVLAYVINVAFFGWTIDWATPWTLVLQTPFWVAGAALLAAIIPAWRAANTPLAEAVRAE